MRTPSSSAGSACAGFFRPFASAAVVLLAGVWLLPTTAHGDPSGAQAITEEPPLALAPASEPEDALVESTPVPEESLPPADPLDELHIQELVDQAVEARLAGIPRPRYIPATDLVPPRGLLLYKEAPRSGDFPFAVALGGFLQLRWLEFARDATSWTDSAGNPRQINNINTFNLNRFLISFSGHVVDERLVYNFAFFGTSNVGVRAGVVPIGMAGWKFSDAATVGAGVTPVPGSREWLDKSPWNLGIDRSMANTFFRPGFSPGAAATGSLFDKTVYYEAGVWNAIDGGTSGVLRRGTSMAWAGNTWWEPLSPFGFGYGDMEHHSDPAIRLGTSGVYARTYALGLLGLNPEDTIVRLSDGTPVALPNALGPDSRVDQFRYSLATVDAGWKYRGWAANFEYYFRSLNGFVGSGTFERSSTFDHGGLGYLSWCFVPRTYEVYARSSAITGPYGTGQEYGGGFNWYVNKSRQGRFTLEGLYMSRNPAQNFLYPYRAGYTGTAIQTQYVVAF
jgi:hypothetical protein